MKLIRHQSIILFWLSNCTYGFIVPPNIVKNGNHVPGSIISNPFTRDKITFTNIKAEESKNNDNENNIEDSMKMDEEEEEFKSAALDWAKEQAKELEEMDKQKEKEGEQMMEDNKNKKKKYVVVGGGWAGWGAVKALCQSQINAEVILLDALPDPTGTQPYLSKSGKPVEAGTRGFWKDYPNIYSLCDELKINEHDIFTPYTNSSFYSPDGLEATAPVFSEAKILIPSFLTESITSSFADSVFPQLPSPLGQVLATFPLFERIPLSDRASMVGLLLATIDCLGNTQDEKVIEAYDRMTAHDLFIKFNLSPRLVEDFIKPTLLVGLFKPPEELSALVVMELLYYYALAHQDSFDVRWIKNGTVADSLISPLSTTLMNDYKDTLQVKGGSFVKTISVDEINDSDSKMKASKVSYTTRNPTDGTINEHTIDDIDGIILSVGCKGMRSIVSSSPDLARIPVFANAASLQGIDVISVRLWLDTKVHTRTPANVFSRFNALRGAGGTFFMLDQFQEGNEDALWGNDEVQGSVVACDFYNAGRVINLSDDDIIDILMKELLPSAVPKFADAKVVDSWVGKYPGTVSWFSPGSYTLRPPLEGAGKAILSNIKCAGDWVKMGEREHGAKGLCQERAFVSGIEAANSLLKSTVSSASEESYKMLDVLPVRDDEIQFQMAVQANNAVMKYLPRFWVR